MNESFGVCVVGLGWTGEKVKRACEEKGVSVCATTQTGRNGTIEFRFDEASDDLSPFRRLPNASLVLVTFPIKGASAMGRFHDFYMKTHSGGEIVPRFVLLGTTSMWGYASPQKSQSFNRFSPPDNPNDERYLAEMELLARGGCVLSLAGLWDDQRHPRNWISRLAQSKATLQGKGSLHLIHGRDIAEAIVMMYLKPFPPGRWILTDREIYDVWEIVTRFDRSDTKFPSLWVKELMEEKGVEVLPRKKEELGRTLDSDEFWKTLGLEPSMKLY